MLDEALLRTTYRAALKKVTLLPKEKYLAWENHHFEPPEPEEDQIWVEEFITILSEQQTTVGCIEATGTVQYSVNIPAGQGTAAGDALARAIALALAPAQSLTAGGQTAILERTERAPYRSRSKGSVWVFKTVTSRWRVFTISAT